MFAVPLDGGGLLVHSPTWLGDDTFTRLEALGTPRVLFAPNHFHHVSLARFRERYPEALAVAAEGALPRLRAKGHEGLRELADAEPLLPGGARFLRCEGTKTGEAWISIPGEGGPTLVVSDAFFHVLRPVTGFTGFLLRSLGTLPGLRIGSTFRWIALADRAAYRAWAKETIRRERPARLAVSHGDTLEVADLAERLVALVDERLG